MNVDHGIGIMKNVRGKMVACGSTNGQVMLRDAVSLKVEHTLDAHSATVSDIDVQDNILVTCGFSSRYNEQYRSHHIYIYMYIHLIIIFARLLI